MNTQPQKKKKARQMQDKPKVVKASPNERKSERSENGNRREEEMEKKPRRERVNGVRMGKEWKWEKKKWKEPGQDTWREGHQ